MTGQGSTVQEDDYVGPVAQDDAAYPTAVPLTGLFHCRLCSPIPKWSKRRGDLSKHKKVPHATASLQVPRMR
jgi:hypothetical protein